MEKTNQMITPLDKISKSVLPSVVVDRVDIVSALAECRNEALNGCEDQDQSLFVGINNHAIGTTGYRDYKKQLLRVFNAERWREELCIYDASNLQVDLLPTEKGEFTTLVRLPEVDARPLSLRFYGVSIKDGFWPEDTPRVDARANILNQALICQAFEAELLYVFVEVSPITASPEEDGLEDDADEQEQEKSTTPVVDTEISDDMRTLRDCADDEAAAGNFKEAWLMVRDSIDPTIEVAEVPSVHERAVAPPIELETGSEGTTAGNFPTTTSAADPRERRSFRPSVAYKLANGNLHVIPAGLYSSDEFFQATLHAQELVDASFKNDAGGNGRRTPGAAFETTNSISRSLSQSESIEAAEQLKPLISAAAAHGRLVMKSSREASRNASREASPQGSETASPKNSHQTSPKLTATAPPMPLPDVEAVGVSLVDLHIREKSEEKQAEWAAASVELAERAKALWGGA